LGLELHFQPQVWAGLSMVPPRLESFVSQLLLRLEAQVQARGVRWTAPRGSLVLESAIPLGAGLGSSAALCVALTRWVQEEARLSEGEVFEFARSLEDEFHGKSSGMDVAVALAGKPIRFSSEGGLTPLPLNRLPSFTFHDTGLRASTKECIAEVEALRETDPLKGALLDEQMKEASRETSEALLQFSNAESSAAKDASISTLARAMEKAQQSFEGWGLVPASVVAQIATLKREGALAVKLTGAGRGGFLVALRAPA
jgi:mevalonate kinase